MNDIFKDILQKWDSLPEIVRWFLCWPAFLIPTFVICFLAAYAIPFIWGHWDAGETFSSDGTPNSLVGLIQMLGVLGITYYSFFSLMLLLIPRGQDIVAALFALLLVLIGLVSACGSIFMLLDGEMSILKAIGSLIYACGISGGAAYSAFLVRRAVMHSKRYLFDL